MKKTANLENVLISDKKTLAAMAVITLGSFIGVILRILEAIG